MSPSTSPFGIPTVGDLPWRNHVCHFYREHENLVDSLVYPTERGNKLDVRRGIYLY